jgi:general secretion pathway protein K
MRRKEEGVALVAVLWTLILLSLVAASLSFESRTSARVARNAADAAAVRAAADAGVTRAILDLLTPGSGKSFRTDGTLYNWPFGESRVYISVQDEFSKVNLNYATEAVLTSIIRSVGIDQAKAQSLADAIADFRDSDNIPRLQGAEEADYRAAGVGWGPKNAFFQTIEELQQVLGMTPQIYERIIPDLTVYSGWTVNPDLASDRLKVALRRVGFRKFLPSSHGIAYSISAVAKSSTGATFVREATVQAFSGSPSQVRVLTWRSATTGSPPNGPVAQ